MIYRIFLKKNVRGSVSQVHYENLVDAPIFQTRNSGENKICLAHAAQRCPGLIIPFFPAPVSQFLH